MKKKLVVLLSIIFIVLPVSANQETFELWRVNYPILINGQELQSDLPILNWNGNTYIPLRKVSEATGAKVEWDSTNKVVNISTESTQDKTIEEVAENVKSTVFIRAYDHVYMPKAQTIGTGSGIVLDNGTIITNYHVLENALRFGIAYNDTPENQEYRTSFDITSDKDRDIGIIFSPKPVSTPAKIGDSDKLRLGEKVIAIGSPLGLRNSVSEGIISGFRIINGHRFIQTTAPISPGSSGGGLFNMRGELIGITTAKLLNGESLNLAIPINDVKPLLDNEYTKAQISIAHLMRAVTYNDKVYFFDVSVSKSTFKLYSELTEEEKQTFKESSKTGSEVAENISDKHSFKVSCIMLEDEQSMNEFIELFKKEDLQKAVFQNITIACDVAALYGYKIDSIDIEFLQRGGLKYTNMNGNMVLTENSLKR